ncbi:unnamed protein product [Brassicogethes aeneus]|uniref:Uncharacterized protein n=1 Tax=Brassicogethes aeneus TaxID=1431903 RepID=A0A9P0BEV0_BRAAE|nr:unnamed protein product [Brassicogethes aeneus]
MKYLIILACLFAATNAVSKEFMADFVGKVRTLGDKCVGEVKAQPGDIDTLLAHKVPETHEGKCLLFCIHKNFGIQKDDGGWSLEGGLQFIEPLKADDPAMFEDLRKVGVTCSTKVEKDADPCITAVNIAMCLVQEGKAFGITSELFEI